MHTRSIPSSSLSTPRTGEAVTASSKQKEHSAYLSEGTPDGGAAAGGANFWLSSIVYSSIRRLNRFSNSLGSCGDTKGTPTVVKLSFSGGSRKQRRENREGQRRSTRRMNCTDASSSCCHHVRWPIGGWSHPDEGNVGRTPKS